MEDAKVVEEAEKLGKKMKQKVVMNSSILKDDRFKDLFENPNFQIDKNTEEYK